MMEKEQAKRAFRNALGSFATGVTIATTKDKDGNPIGVTASSFNAVSLEPPLILWSLAKESFSQEAFRSSGHFAVHVLAATQEDLSNHFAHSAKDKFTTIGWKEGKLGAPILCDYAALFECRTRHQYEGGDHTIFVGEVIAYEAHDEAPLLFHSGRYAEHRPKPPRDDEMTVDMKTGRFSDNFLFYLISRAYFQTSRPTRSIMRELGLGMGEYLTLALLSMDAPATASTIAKRLAHTDQAPDQTTLDSMVARGFLIKTQDSYDLANTGRNYLLQTLAFGKAMEDDLANHFTPGELAETKRVLRRVIDLTGRDIDWRD